MTQLEHIKNTFLNSDIQFYMRTRNQEEYHPDNIQKFSSESFKIAYILDDIAELTINDEISQFLNRMAVKLRKNKLISFEELEVIKLALRKCYKPCKENHYVDVKKKFDIS